MKIRNNFQCKQFSISQQHAAMPVTTDACIFGAYCDFAQCRQILDIGAGTGILSLMLAQRFPHAIITGMEKDNGSFADSSENFSNSKWKDRLKAIHGDILQYNSENVYDGIICNPPFFEQQLASENEVKSKARHMCSLNYAALAHVVKSLLSEAGKVFFLVPTLHTELCKKEMEFNALYLQKKAAIRAINTKSPHVNILEFGHNPVKVEVSDIVTYSSFGVLSEECKLLLKDFYLHL